MIKKVTDEIASKPKLYAVLLVAHLIVTTLTWRDLRRRSSDQIRGPKHIEELLTGEPLPLSHHLRFH